MDDGLKTVWQIEPHTIAKHMILKNYLQAWFRIMGAYNEKIVFMDGYAGPGEYSKGEEGSPIIALKEAMDYLDSCEKNGWKKPEIVFLFIEQDKDRFSTLETKIREMKLPKELKVSLENSSFEVITKDILSYLENEQVKLAPSFIFIDPFGYNLPFELIQRLMKYEKCEVFINFMYEFINRFIQRDGQDSVMTRLFGTDDWKKINFDELTSPKRKEAIHNLYKEQLEKHAASFVRSFEMRGKKNTTKYFLFMERTTKKD
ncbi:three-Cys-motif partner protein TcmP [Tepidibacillus marianensis]|uniref:three-Cys-motif partner protein TcmP n=1 Tax=Tepidibacillus marianensis TaxID=3131995 RepID=UPI0030CED780